MFRGEYGRRVIAREGDDGGIRNAVLRRKLCLLSERDRVVAEDKRREGDGYEVLVKE